MEETEIDYLLSDFLEFVTENCTYEQLSPPLNDKDSSAVVTKYKKSKQYLILLRDLAVIKEG